jgi:Ion channel
MKLRAGVVRRPAGLERRGEPLASQAAFARRLGWNIAVAAAIILASLAIGTTGYMTLEGMSFIDAVLNASMILSTMGPVSPLHTTGGKIFASVYAILSGLLLFAIAGLIMAPVYHRMMHRFHLEDEGAE